MRCSLTTCWLLLRAYVCLHGVCVQVTTCGSTYSAVSYSGAGCTGTATAFGPIATNTCNAEANGSSDLTTCGAADPCAGISCGAHGSCSSGTCTCAGGYTGTTCATPPSVAVASGSMQAWTNAACSGTPALSQAFTVGSCFNNNAGSSGIVKLHEAQRKAWLRVMAE